MPKQTLINSFTNEFEEEGDFVEFPKTKKKKFINYVLGEWAKERRERLIDLRQNFLEKVF